MQTLIEIPKYKHQRSNFLSRGSTIEIFFDWTIFILKLAGMTKRSFHWLEYVKVGACTNNHYKVVSMQIQFSKETKKKKCLLLFCEMPAWPSLPASGMTVTSWEHDSESIEVLDSIANRNDIF